MRRRRKKNRGAKWLLALVAIGALAWFGRSHWMGWLPHEAPSETVVALPAPEPAPAATVAPAATATMAGAEATAQPTSTAVFMSEATARDEAARAAREQTLKVQRLLRENQKAQQDQAAAADNDPNARCIDGQKMKRVDNGWVQAGTCP